MQSGDECMLPTKANWPNDSNVHTIWFKDVINAAQCRTSWLHCLMPQRKQNFSVKSTAQHHHSPTYFVGCIYLSIECIVTKLNYGIVLEFMEGSRYWEQLSWGRHLWWCQYSREAMASVTFVIVEKQWSYTFALVSEVPKVILKLSFWESVWKKNSSRPAYRATSATLKTDTWCKIHPSMAEIAARVMEREILSVCYGRRGEK